VDHIYALIPDYTHIPVGQMHTVAAIPERQKCRLTANFRRTHTILFVAVLTLFQSLLHMYVNSCVDLFCNFRRHTQRRFVKKINRVNFNVHFYSTVKAVVPLLKIFKTPNGIFHTFIAVFKRTSAKICPYAVSETALATSSI